MMNSEFNMPILKSNASDLELQAIGSRPKTEPIKVMSSDDSSEKPAVEQKSEEPISEKELSTVVTEMNSVAQNLQRDLLFSVDEKTGGTFVKVIDKETDEVIREIPSKDIREIKSRLDEVSGMIFQDNA